jgi:ABC-type nickel/cobalt efflux system permease component RcnA
MYSMQQEVSVFLGVILFGLLHGLNPSHGWIVAVLYSIRKKRQIISSLISSGIIAGAHFLSSIVVVLAFIFVTSFVKIPIPQSYLNYGVAITLGILAFMFWREKSEDLTKTQHGHLHDTVSLSTQSIEHEHEHWHKESGMHTHLHLHEKRVVASLTTIAVFGLMLGFAHEEEFVILSLAVGGVNPTLLMLVYASAVSAALIGITVLSVKIFTRIQHRILPYLKYLPKISAMVLAVMALLFAFGQF